MHDTIYCLVHVVGGPQKQPKDLNFQGISCTLHCVTYELIVSPPSPPTKKNLYETLTVSINLSIYLAWFLYFHTPQSGSLRLHPRPQLCPPFWFHRKYGRTHSVGWKRIPYSEKLLRGFLFGEFAFESPNLKSPIIYYAIQIPGNIQCKN